MGRKLLVLLEVAGKKPRFVFDKLLMYLKRANYEILEMNPPNRIVAKAGNKWMTYLLGTSRWERALRTAYITIRYIPKITEVEILWDVSWMVVMISLPRAASREVKRIAKFIGAKVRGYKRVPAI